MKKIILSVLLVSLSHGLFAQFGKGAMAITGTVGLSGNKNSTTQTSTISGTTTPTFDQKTSSFAFVPAFSYFVSNKLEVGVALAIMKSTTNTDFHPQGGNQFATSTTKSENPLNAFGVFANYYLMNEARYAWYVGAQFGIGGGTGKFTNKLVNGTETITETKNNGSIFGLNTGFLYFVKSNLALNANFGLLSFNTIKTESTSNNVTTNTKNSNWVFGVNGVIINIGLKYFLRTNSTAAMTPAP
jgi:hypothetical protein